MKIPVGEREALPGVDKGIDRGGRSNRGSTGRSTRPGVEAGSTRGRGGINRGSRWASTRCWGQRAKVTPGPGPPGCTKVEVTLALRLRQTRVPYHFCVQGKTG
jgi:hypothetical protein